jgi:glycosyltransferase involved in cell wall biosynthesis
MRILHLVHQYPPDHVGGTENYTQSLARSQSQCGHQVAVFSRRNSAGAGLEAHNEGDVQVWIAHHDTLSPVRRFAATFGDSFIERAFDHVLHEFAPQLVHVQHLMGLPASLLTILQRQRIPYLVTLHDYWWVCANAQLLTNDTQQICGGPRGYTNCARCAAARLGQRAWSPFAYGLVPMLAGRNLILWRALERARALIAPTQFVARWHYEHGIPAERIVTIPHGVERAIGATDRPRGSRVRLRFACVGGLAWQKGIHIAVQAMQAVLNEAELWIAGDESFDPTYMQQLRAKAPANVSFLGELSRQEVWATLAQVDAVLVPSLWYETFSLIAHEAHVAGVPVIASRLGALAEIVHDEMDGLLVTPGDVVAWECALCRVVEHRALLDHWQEGIRKPLTPEQHSERIDILYGQVMAQPTEACIR